MISVLQIDDEPALLDLSKIFLEMRQEFRVESCSSPKKALEILKEREFDAVVTDNQMDEMSGIDLIKEIRNAGLNTPVILFTGQQQEELLGDSQKFINHGYVQKNGSVIAMFNTLSLKLKTLVRIQKKSSINSPLWKDSINPEEMKKRRAFAVRQRMLDLGRTKKKY